jgi:hypothetical protein
MHDAAAPAIAGWQNFYVIIGSSAAALTGLQFVVVALVKDSRRRATSREIDAFATPTILHFSAVLLVSAIVSAPWPSLLAPAIVLGVCGGAGVVYVVIVIRRTRRQTTYQPVLEDWIWHALLPFLAYAALFAAALVLAPYAPPSLFVIGGTALLLLFVGIHNAWDAVTFILFDQVEASTRN